MKDTVPSIERNLGAKVKKKKKKKKKKELTPILNYRTKAYSVVPAGVLFMGEKANSVVPAGLLFVVQMQIYSIAPAGVLFVMQRQIV